MTKDKDEELYIEEVKKEEEQELDNIINVFFNNMNADDAPEDTVGVDTPMMFVKQLEDEIKEVESEEEINTSIETEDEEVFLVHSDGQITSEVEDAEDNKVVHYKQSLFDRAITNKAINNLYEDLESYKEELDVAYKMFQTTSLTSEILDEPYHASSEKMNHIRHQLMLTKFSRYKEVPLDEVDVDLVEDEKIKEAIEKEVDRLIAKILGVIN